MKIRILSINFVALLVASLLFAPAPIYAFGLGKLKVASALNEPFEGEIPVLALSEGDVDNLEVMLASHEEFERAGLERNYFLTQFTFEIIEGANGETKILVKSEQSVREPFIDFLITATAGNGRLIREYTVLLDPPKNVFARKEKITEEEIDAESLAINANDMSDERLVRVDDEEETERDNYRVIVSGDTLWEIALETRPDRSVSPQQMMVALKKQNPHAFLNDNINGLKVDARLLIPDADAIDALSKGQAIAAVKQQNDLWQNRHEMAALTEEESGGAQLETLSVPTESIDEASAELIEQEVTDGVARLRLETPDDISAKDGDLQESDLSLTGDNNLDTGNEQLTFSQQTVEGQIQENIDIDAQMEAIEEEIKTSNQLIALGDNDLARIQSQLEQEKGQEVPLSETMNTDEGGANEAAVVNEETPLSNNESFWAKNKIMIIAGLLVIIAVVWFIVRRYHSKQINWDDNGVVSAEDLLATIDSYIDKDDLTTAKRLLEGAYQQYPQNVQILKKLFFVLYQEKQVVRFTKLIEEANIDEESPIWSDVSDWGRQIAPNHVLFKQDQEEDIATATHQDIEHEVASDELADDVLETDLDENQSENETMVDLNLEDSDQDDGPSFDIGADDKPERSVNQNENIEDSVAFNLDLDKAQDEGLSFDIDKDDKPEEENAPTTNLSVNNNDKIEEDAFDLSFEQGSDDDRLAFELPSSPDSNDDSQEQEQALDLSDIDNADTDGLSITLVDEDSDANDVADDNEEPISIDEAETKIDLAQAYIDIGDSDGAKVILNEVLAEGNDEQKARAQSLLDNLSS